MTPFSVLKKTLQMMTMIIIVYFKNRCILSRIRMGTDDLDSVIGAHRLSSLCFFKVEVCKVL